MPNSYVSWLVVHFSIGYLLLMPAIGGALLNYLSNKQRHIVLYRILNWVGFAFYIIAFASVTPLVLSQAKAHGYNDISSSITLALGAIVGLANVVLILHGVKRLVTEK